jgi:ATP-dependent protease HslVU (ClpYQ) peptidase subunit
MSTVAWDGTTLAADRQMTTGDLKRETTKLFVTAPTIFAFTGTVEGIHALMHWYRGGMERSKWPAFQATDRWTRMIIVDRYTRKCIVYEQEPFAQDVAAPMAWGSGREFALGALLAGADAFRAVEIACALDINSGFGVDHERCEEV